MHAACNVVRPDADAYNVAFLVVFYTTDLAAAQRLVHLDRQGKACTQLLIGQRRNVGPPFGAAPELVVQRPGIQHQRVDQTYEKVHGERHNGRREKPEMHMTLRAGLAAQNGQEPIGKEDGKPCPSQQSHYEVKDPGQPALLRSDQQFGLLHGAGLAIPRSGLTQRARLPRWPIITLGKLTSVVKRLSIQNTAGYQMTQ